MTSSRATFFHYLGSHRLQLLVGVCLAAGSSLAAVVPPRFIGEIIDSLQSPRATFDDVLRLALLIVLFAGLEAVLRAGARYVMLDASRKAEYSMRNDLFAHLQRMHLAYFQHQRIGDLMARMTNDLTWVRQMMGPGIMQGSFTAMVFTFSVLSMISVSLKLTVIALILMPLASLTFWYIGRTVHLRFERLQAQFGDMSTKAQENFSGIRVVKAFSQESAETKDFAKVNYEYFRRAVALSVMQGLIWPSISFILGIAVLSVLYVGGQDAIRGELSIGALVQFVAYLYLLQMPMINIGWISNMFQAGWASLGRLQEIFAAAPKITDPIDPVTAPIKGEVEFRGVSFAYGQAIELHDVSFKVPAGGSLAIVGPTGSGKSTVVNLIPRLFDVQQGEVLIDGIDIRRRPLEQLRRAVGYVPQETFLFSVPLRENVGFGVDEALTDPQLDWAGDVSQLNKDVEDFPARYDTMIGERGVTLSGGQKQRAAIARAVAKDPRILILDDALSAVDTYTEAEILRRMRGVMRERTSIVVAHRISTVKDADEILVLDDGRIVERGSHRDLLEHGGLYAQMYRRQLLEEELDVDEEREEHSKRVKAESDEGPRLGVRPRLGG
ncbi:MAG TPA: ABC transporter ATP-binding protein, partial [Candidatus Limnocylindria bacterium]|nr:ABC transporter ATP-binding protein [Candidatus Limnocylindria bacterium]